MARCNYLRGRRGIREVEPPEAPPEYVPYTEHEEARRATRDWLRTETNEFEDYGGAFDGFNVYSDSDSGL